MRITIIRVLLLAFAIAALPLSASAGRLYPPEHAVGVVLGQSFVGVLVYDDETELRVGDNWYRIQVPAARVERFAAVTSVVVGSLAVAIGIYAVRRRWIRRHASST